MLQSNICTSTQLKSADFQRWMAAIGHPPMVMHRKLWEWAYICQALDERGMLAPGKRGLGFAVGREPLVALFAARGCEIVASDLDEISAESAGWASTGQHANSVAVLNAQGLCPADAFAERVSFRVVDMNFIPDDLVGFDFVWSSCAIEHLGNIAATEEFMSRMMDCVRPGGVAVHTTEYNIHSNDATVESGATVILRKSDLENIQSRLREEGHAAVPLSLDIGDADDDKVILHPPYEGYPCLKIWIGPHAATSVGLIAEAGDAAPAKRVRMSKPERSALPDSRSFLSGMKAWLAPTPIVTDQIPRAGRPAVDGSGASALDEVRALYRLLLDREADVQGLAYHAGLITHRGVAVRDVAKMLISSDEFAVTHGRERNAIEVQFDGYAMFARPSDRDIGGAISVGNSYEPHVTWMVKRELKVGDTFLDVGANIGYFTMLAAHIVGTAGKVIAVEPMSKNFELIYAGIARNGYSNVEVFPFGASDGVRIVSMVTDPGTSNALIQSAPSQKRISAFASTRTLDWMCADVARIDLLKIDIEGHEVFAWRGGQATLERCRPRILTEFHPHAMRENAGVNFRDYLDLIFGYSRAVQVVVAEGEVVTCTDGDQVMDEWKRADALAGGTGTVHLDLFLAPRT